ncbi:gastrula zinc finger protein XlCGF66.1-like isoform X2 [Hyla sarda]|uniref:gastrula zinc finger protein XlCGF66.1-like isoform X2 n=1 Tax=Hyla sarda TaxID=327740 RepID=UPI0024C2495B|nr:gastrula zinc finger protein XlCGF66.1-like isoform X2 [Hyla sarda]
MFLCLTDRLRMDKDRKDIADRVLNLTLELINLLTGENYTVVKKTSGECLTSSNHRYISRRWSKTQSSIVEPPPHERNHERNDNEKILELTTQIIELLSGEGEDVANVKVEVITEEEIYMRGGQQCKEEEIHVDTSPDGPSNNNAPAPSLCAQYWKENNPRIPQGHQDSHSPAIF